LSRLLRIVGAALLLGAYFLLLAPIGYAVFAVWSLLPSPRPAARRRRFQRIMHRAFRGMHALLRQLDLIDFDPDAVTGRVPEAPCLLVANHPTLIDISALLATVDPVVFPVKPALYGRFWAHPLLATAGAFEGPGLDPFGVGGFVDTAVERLRQGDRVLVFPEGTRSPSERPDTFGRAAIEIAVRAQVPIVPISIRCEPRWLTKESRFLSPPDRVPTLHVHVLDAIPAPAPDSSSRTLRDIVESRIRTDLESV
jgi:1-acyl-sn-glycerol-3-phosphate acyltransferase